MAIKANLSAADTYTSVLSGEVLTYVDHNPNGVIDISIAGIFDGTLTLQRKFTDDTEWRDCDTFNAPFEGTLIGSADALYRVGFKAGEYTSGTASIRLGVGA
jgi:hypothetical protein